MKVKSDTFGDPKDLTKLHCKYIACKKGNFSMSFISHTFSMYFWLSNDCIKCSENNVKFKLEWFLKLPYSIVVGTGIM